MDGEGSQRREGTLVFRPRSIVSLILIGFAVLLAPMTAAVITAVVQVDRLAQAGRAAVLEAEIATQQSRSLIEQITEMQRAIGQFRVLGDDALYENYLERRAIFSNAVDNLLGLSLPEVARQRLTELEREEAELFEILSGERIGTGRLRLPETTRLWRDLIDHARDVLAESSRLIETQANNSTEAADDVQRLLLIQAAAVIPLTLFLAGVLVVLITRPMREVAGAIRGLGARELDREIAVRGPRDLERLGEELDWLRRRIKDLEHQKINFLRHISHELKTPLATIREGAELLAESCVNRDPEDAELSRIMVTNSLHLQKLIEDLLQFGKTQELVTDLKVADSASLRDIVRSSVATHSLAIASKKLDVEQNLPALRIRADENKLRIVMDNLVNNAIKYTPVGGRLSISLARQAQNAVIDVRDSGPGVLESEREAIFEPFRQGQAKYHANVKGTGLGLAIAKEYVEAHDGYIEVVDSGAGAHFRVVLPVAGPKAGAEA